MEESVKRFIEKHQLLRPGQTIVLGVSGGSDSMALLHYFNEIRSKQDLRIIAASVDHGLRGEESRQDLQLVADICEEWDIEFKGVQCDVASYKQEHKLGTQQAARTLRYQFFHEMMQEAGADALALGHHGDDQAETMVMQLIRGTNIDALKGIPITRPFATGRIIRPFLSVSKQEIRTYCKKKGIRLREDPSNQEDTYTRNYLRLHVLPLLKEKNPRLSEHLQLMSERVREDLSYLNAQAEQALKAVVQLEPAGPEAAFDIVDFQTLPTALQRRTFHLILNYLYDGRTMDLSYIHEEQFFAMLDPVVANARLDFPDNLSLHRNYGRISFYFGKKDESSPYHFELQPGESIMLPNGSELTAKTTACRDAKEDQYTFACDVTHVKLPLIIRTRQDGDRMTLKGMSGSKKIKDIFIDQKVPIEQRADWPIVTDQSGNILWLAGLKKSNIGKKDSQGNWLQLHYKYKEEM
ncbi:tRNA lysidine(34) synthetase TilS [Thalassobacillus pellis]|uniref:tRNA lysidine(34) synthetase TilS n=1 Tax=Thalassobacillus pellis TaxID=748008 RepID=UPI0019608E4F|nr:tRNA lysidine(34) synthetase TilS [Thalassobacillus pellis]MBM7555143.1 tRNA(Ile)-lysidine synthase [Thalassobacillus pellis]